MLDLRRIKPRTGKNRYFIGPALSIQGEADADSPLYNVAAVDLAKALQAVIASEPRTTMTDRTQDGLAMQFVQRSAVFRFPDTIDVDVIALSPQQSALAIYSRSRYGRRDFGVNRRRVERWLAALAAKLGPDRLAQPASPPKA